jgi:hypothetical protein
MQYTKPQIHDLGAASKGIQGNTTKIDPEFPDATHPNEDVCSPAAYEADE